MSRNAVTTHQAPTSPTYSQAVVAGDLIFVSGTVGRNMETGEWPEGIEAQTEQALKNMAAVLEAAGSSLDHVVKATVWLTDPAHGAQIADIWAKFFPSPPPARSAPVVRGFPISGALISIEAIAVKQDK